MIKIDKYSWDLKECLLFGFQLESQGDEFKMLNYIAIMAKKFIYLRILNNNNNFYFISLGYLKSQVFYELETCILYNKNEVNFEWLYSLL